MLLKVLITARPTADGNTFFIDGREFDHHRVDHRGKLGDAEEWTIRNVSGERHVFRIHQVDFLVTGINGEAQDFGGFRDVIDILYQSGDQPGEVKIVIPFTVPNIVAQFPSHAISWSTMTTE